MTKIAAYSRTEPKRRLTPQERIKKREDAATVGGATAAGVSASATKMASRRRLKGGILENEFRQVMSNVQEATRAVNQNTQVATGLWSTFKANVRMYTQDILKRLDSLKSNKFISRVVDSPIIKKSAGVFGAGLAFFVLVTGVNKAFKTGSVAVCDFKSKMDDLRA